MCCLSVTAPANAQRPLLEGCSLPKTLDNPTGCPEFSSPQPTFRSQPRDYEARWVRSFGTAVDPWSRYPGAYRDQLGRAVCGHGANCQCGTVSYCGNNWLNGQRVLWWPNGCGSPPETLICQTREIGAQQPPAVAQGRCAAARREFGVFWTRANRVGGGTCKCHRIYNARCVPGWSYLDYFNTYARAKRAIDGLNSRQGGCSC